MTEQEEKTQEIQENKGFDMDSFLNTEHKPSSSGDFVDKSQFIGAQKQIKILGFKPPLPERKAPLLEFEMDSKSYVIEFRSGPRNKLLALLGGNLKDWTGKLVYVTGEAKSWNIKGNIQEGVELSFSL